MHSEAFHKKISVILIMAAIFIALYLARNNSGLENFLALTKNDPLIYDALLNADAFEKEISRIEQYENEFLQEQNINDEIFGLSHFKILGAVKKTTENLISSTSAKNALELINHQKAFADEYKKNAENYLNLLRSIFAGREDQKIIFFGSATTPGIIMDDMSLVIKNADALLAEIESRKICFETGACEANQNKNDLHFLENADPQIGDAYQVKTGCFGFDGENPKKQSFYLFEKNGAIVPKLAAESYYMVTEKFKDFDARAMAMWKRGKKYDLQLETLGYRCTDLTYWPNLIAQYHLSAGENPNGTMKDLIWTLPTILKSITNIEFLLASSKIEKNPMPRDYLYSVHTAYSIFYLPFSPSVWRIKEQPQYLLRENFAISEEYITHSDLIKMGYTEKQLIACCQ